MFVAVAGMTAMSIRTVMHNLATKETFIDASVNIDMNAGIEHFDKVIPSNFVLSADDIVYKTSLAKERKYNKAVMDGVIEEKRANLRR
jgi:CO dehydrogenase nickel-insertion accessory protein CooC1